DRRTVFSRKPMNNNKITFHLQFLFLEIIMRYSLFYVSDSWGKPDEDEASGEEGGEDSNLSSLADGFSPSHELDKFSTSGHHSSNMPKSSSRCKAIWSSSSSSLASAAPRIAIKRFNIHCISSRSKLGRGMFRG